MKHRLSHYVALGLTTALMVACSNGGDTSTPVSPTSSELPPPSTPPATPPPDAATVNPANDKPASDAEAARFLTQAAFGPTHEEIAKVKQLGYSAWLDEQLKLNTTKVLPYIDKLQTNYNNEHAAIDVPRRSHYWIWSAAKNNDQLRLRMAFALSQIFVASDYDSGGVDVERTASYQDMLADNAFVEYRTLLNNVTLHPAMGDFLSYRANQKASADGNRTPDENYAREVMQLFSIGLIEREKNFNPKLDAKGNTISTYNQQTVSDMAKVFTGWALSRSEVNNFAQWEPWATKPMECWQDYHDTTEKTIVSGVKVPAGGSCEADLKITLDTLARHSNTAPFISRQLIQRFVTSNPKPEYIERVVNVWQNTNGNLGSVIKAILLDEEARKVPAAADLVYGKAREPVIRIASLWRAFNASYIPDQSKELNGTYYFQFPNGARLTDSVGQDVMRSPSVFNYFEPDYTLPRQGNGQQSFYAPEFQIINAATYYNQHNINHVLIWESPRDKASPNDRFPHLNLTKLAALGEQKKHAEMVEELNLLLFYGSLSQRSKDAMIGMLDKLTHRSGDDRARALMSLALLLPEYAVQR